MKADEKWAAVLPRNAYGPMVVSPLPLVSPPKARPYRGKIIVTQKAKPAARPFLISLGCAFTQPHQIARWETGMGRYKSWVIGSVGQDIIASVCWAFNIDRHELFSQRQYNEVCRPRFAAMTLCKEFTDWSLPRIARFLKKRDHTTVMNGLERSAVLVKTDAAFREALGRARQVLAQEKAGELSPLSSTHSTD